MAAATFPQRLPDSSEMSGFLFERLFNFVRPSRATMILHADSENWHLTVCWFDEEHFREFSASGREPEDVARAFLDAQVREREGASTP